MESIWQKTSELPRFGHQSRDIHTNVLVIGGGIAGILTAYMLHQSGVNYVLVEKNRVCSGTTQNTTAKITCQHGLIYHKILKAYGLEKAQQYFYANLAAFNKYSELSKKIDCDYEIKDNYVYSVSDRKKLLDEMDALSKIKCSAEFIDKVNLPINTMGAIKFSNQAQFNPLKFLSSISKSLNIYENTFVREMIGNTAVTNYGKIFADKVIAATHFPFINKHGSYFLKLYQHRSYVIALEKAANLDGMYVDENKTGLSFRNYGDYLLLGGGGHRTGHNGGNWREIRAFAKKEYPGAKEKCFWSAQDCMSLDSIPYIGPYSKSTNNFYVASGFNKWGMTGAMAAAMILNDIILEKANNYANVFNPSRSILKRQLIINGFEATKSLLTISKKRCPHLGCALKWNSAEKSWDCPCHGSRFAEDGTVLDNPANAE